VETAADNGAGVDSVAAGRPNFAFGDCRNRDLQDPPETAWGVVGRVACGVDTGQSSDVANRGALSSTTYANPGVASVQFGVPR
jgi:hypothetical protein